MKVLFFFIVLFTLYGCDSDSMGNGAIIGAHKLYDDGKYNEAISRVFRAESKYEYGTKESAELKYILAESYFKLKQYKKAELIYKLIVEKYPKTIYADLSRTVLKEQGNRS